jgi:hypothetical protein
MTLKIESDCPDMRSDEVAGTEAENACTNVPRSATGQYMSPESSNPAEGCFYRELTGTTITNQSQHPTSTSNLRRLV